MGEISVGRPKAETVRILISDWALSTIEPLAELYEQSPDSFFGEDDDDQIAVLTAYDGKNALRVPRDPTVARAIFRGLMDMSNAEDDWIERKSRKGPNYDPEGAHQSKMARNALASLARKLSLLIYPTG